MPRPARSLHPGACYHLISRGNERATVFHTPLEYRRFLELIEEAQQRCHVPLLAACLMPNHFHLVVISPGREPLCNWLQWLLTTHSHRYNVYRERVGHVWQGRYKSFQIQNDDHLLTVMRYVERNPCRAGLVQRAENWPWGSLAWRSGRSKGPELADPPLALPGAWNEWVNRPQSPTEIDALRRCVNRQQPYGAEDWVQETAERDGMTSTLRPKGRPPARRERL